MKNTILISIILFSLSFGAESIFGAERGLMYRGVRAIGMGDARIAAGNGGVEFVHNPALLCDIDKRVTFSLPNLPVFINDGLWDIGKFISDNSDNFGNYDDLTAEEKDAFIKDLEPYDGKWARVNVSPMVNAAAVIRGMNIGFSAYYTQDVSLKIDRGIYDPRIWGEGISNAVFVLGAAKSLLDIVSFAPEMNIGLNLKYIDRRAAPLFRINSSQIGSFNETIDTIVEDAKDNAEQHFAADMGILCAVPAIHADIGAAIRNIGYAEYASVDIGIAKRYLENRLLVLADYIDLLDNNRENAFRKFHIGGEYELGVLSLRAGLNSGYPTAGAGLNFGVISIDAAYFTDELSNAPGVNGEQRYALQVRLGW